jgi:16S rRNA (guanine527-N7)-methyltransferase
MDELAQWATAYGLSLSAEQSDRFATYEALLLEWNERIALTAIREPREIRIRHFLDSLTCAVVTGPLDGRSLIDIGSGAGFPGLPLKILYPDLRLTLVDSVAKKTRFLERVVEALGLADVNVVAERAETLGHEPVFREQFDWAVGRAVAELRVLVELGLPLCRVGGWLLAQKGSGAAAEVVAAGPAIAALGGGEPSLTTVQLPETSQPHFLVVVPKVAPTGSRYPRRPGIPAKRPL